MRETASPLQFVQDPVTADKEILVDLLDRVVRQIFAIGIALSVTRDDGTSIGDTRRTVEQLDVLVSDVRKVAMAWQFVAGQPSVSDDRRESEVPAAIVHLRRASMTLERRFQGDATTADGGEWIALDQARHHLHASIASLQSTWPDGAA